MVIKIFDCCQDRWLHHITRTPVLCYINKKFDIDSQYDMRCRGAQWACWLDQMKKYIYQNPRYLEIIVIQAKSQQLNRCPASCPQSLSCIKNKIKRKWERVFVWFYNAYYIKQFQLVWQVQIKNLFFLNWFNYEKIYNFSTLLLN